MIFCHFLVAIASLQPSSLTPQLSTTILTSMLFTTITNTNRKGQVVIPQNMRKALGITKDVPIRLSLRGQVIFVEPIKELVTVAETESSYAELLSHTQGSRASDPESTKGKTAKKEARARSLLTKKKALVKNYVAT